MANNTRDLEELEQLDVIESSTLKVGNAFHAFRFSINIAKLDPATVRTLEAAVDKLVAKGLTKTEAIKQIESAADFSAVLGRAAKKVAKIR
jgi:hypothetical protein